MSFDNRWTRGIAALVISAAFMLVLVVASVEQQAAAELKAHNVESSYSVARSKLQLASAAQRDLKAANLHAAQLRKAGAALQSRHDQLELELYARLQDVAALARTIARSKLCSMLAEPPAAGSVVQPSLWDTVQDCAEDGKVPPATSDDFESLRSPNNNPTLISRTINGLDQEIKRNAADVQQAMADGATAQQSIDGARAVTEALQDVVVLDDNGVISRITRFPPILMQIILCLVSGLFGALLLTLILVVYPHNDFGFVAAESFWNRIFVGGLIAVAVFVVIGSGVSVLGSSRALIEDANVMSYTTVGILAGMFSERVALFLSRQGQMFEGMTAEEAKAKVEARKEALKQGQEQKAADDKAGEGDEEKEGDPK